MAILHSTALQKNAMYSTKCVYMTNYILGMLSGRVRTVRDEYHSYCTAMLKMLMRLIVLMYSEVMAMKKRWRLSLAWKSQALTSPTGCTPIFPDRQVTREWIRYDNDKI